MPVIFILTFGNTDTAVRILRRACEGGMTYFDTARAYSDSEEKMGIAFGMAAEYGKDRRLHKLPAVYRKMSL